MHNSMCHHNIIYLIIERDIKFVTMVNSIYQQTLLLLLFLFLHFSAASPRLRAGARGGRARRTRTEPRAVAAGPLRLRRCAARGAGALHWLFARVRSLLLFSFRKY